MDEGAVTLVERLDGGSLNGWVVRYSLLLLVSNMTQAIEGGTFLCTFTCMYVYMHVIAVVESLLSLCGFCSEIRLGRYYGLSLLTANRLHSHPP